MNPYKVFVRVFVEFDENGRMIPRYIKWEDDNVYKISKVLDCTPGFAAKAGGCGDKYRILVDGTETYLFFERNASIKGNNIGCWFVERRY